MAGEEEVSVQSGGKAFNLNLKSMHEIRYEFSWDLLSTACLICLLTWLRIRQTLEHPNPGISNPFYKQIGHPVIDL